MTSSVKRASSTIASLSSKTRGRGQDEGLKTDHLPPGRFPPLAQHAYTDGVTESLRNSMRKEPRSLLQADQQHGGTGQRPKQFRSDSR